jgi:predicted phosphodiesterase
MRIAVLADIHANLAALEAVLADLAVWRPHRVVVAGDVINRGPQPRECLERVLDLAGQDDWHFVRGNHEDFVLREGRAKSDDPPWLAEVYQHTRWTFEQVRAYEGLLGDWPDDVEVWGEGRDALRCTHASMRSNRHGLYPNMTDGELEGLMGPPSAVLAVGHTHIPFVRQVNGTLLVNAGAVGLPFDRDPRAAYARLVGEDDRWGAEVVRLPYDRASTEAAYLRSGYAEGGGPMIPLIRDELQHARPWLSRWHHDCEAAVAAGRMTVAASVQALLKGA